MLLDAWEALKQLRTEMHQTSNMMQALHPVLAYQCWYRHVQVTLSNIHAFDQNLVCLASLGWLLKVEGDLVWAAMMIELDYLCILWRYIRPYVCMSA